MTKLQASKREGKVSAAELRVDGKVPAILYGPKQEPITVAIPYNDMEKAFKEAGESTLVELHDGETSHDVLIHEVQFDPVTDQIIHVDFYVVERGKKLEVSVPLVFEGLSPAEKNLGGVLVKVMYEIEVESLPRNLPHNIVVDVTTLVDFDSKILVSDLPLSEGVELVTDGDEVVAAISQPQEEEPEEPSEEFDPEAVEVEEKGKQDDESESDKSDKEDKSEKSDK